MEGCYLKPPVIEYHHSTSSGLSLKGSSSTTTLASFPDQDQVSFYYNNLRITSTERLGQQNYLPSDKDSLSEASVRERKSSSDADSVGKFQDNSATKPSHSVQ